MPTGRPADQPTNRPGPAPPVEARPGYGTLTPRSASTARPAPAPHMPCTPPPGGVDAEHRYTPSTAVRYGPARGGHADHGGTGPSSVCRSVPAPLLMSPPT